MTDTASTDKQLHDKQLSHIQDNILEKDHDNFDEELDEDYLPIWYFPSNVYYKYLGVDFILTKHKLNPDPIMMPLYEKFAEEILSPDEAFNLKKDEIENDLQFHLELEPH
jgi:hypothetical protein